MRLYTKSYRLRNDHRNRICVSSQSRVAETLSLTFDKINKSVALFLWLVTKFIDLLYSTISYILFMTCRHLLTSGLQD